MCVTPVLLTQNGSKQPHTTGRGVRAAGGKGVARGQPLRCASSGRPAAAQATRHSMCCPAPAARAPPRACPGAWRAQVRAPRCYAQREREREGERGRERERERGRGRAKEHGSCSFAPCATQRECARRCGIAMSPSTLSSMPAATTSCMCVRVCVLVCVYVRVRVRVCVCVCVCVCTDHKEPERSPHLCAAKHQSSLQIAGS